MGHSCDQYFFFFGELLALRDWLYLGKKVLAHTKAHIGDRPIVDGP